MTTDSTKPTLSPPTLASASRSHTASPYSRQRQILWATHVAELLKPALLLAGMVLYANLTDSFGWPWLERHPAFLGIMVLPVAVLVWPGFRLAWRRCLAARRRGTGAPARRSPHRKISHLR